MYQTMAQRAQNLGVLIRTNSEVASIKHEDGYPMSLKGSEILGYSHSLLRYYTSSASSALMYKVSDVFIEPLDYGKAISADWKQSS